MFINFHSLYERYSQDVYRFALYLCGNASVAEDIAQEAFVRAWVTPGEIREGTVKAYLFMIVRNLYRAELKRGARLVALDDQSRDRNPGPAALTHARMELQAALEALQHIPETDRAAILMHAQDQMSYAEIAAALDLTVAAVKVKVHRARLKLHQLLNSDKVTHENHT